MRFRWDSEKAASNLVKHGVSFEEASTVFCDALSTTVRDFKHLAEVRFLTTGRSLDSGRILIVWHTEDEDSVRMIGARPATPRERRTYESGE
ncbi:MAG: BrnT family toxin [Acidobacteriota bacterium]